MIKYNPKHWLSVIFRTKKGETLSLLFPLMCLIGAYAFIIIFFEKEVLHLPDNSSFKNIPILHAVLGGVISLLLVFRTNSAYDRWWEGRKQWGELTNQSRNLAMKLNAILPAADTHHRHFFRKVISAYAIALKKHLQSPASDWELFDKDLTEAIGQGIDRSKHVPNQLATILFQQMHKLNKNQQISDAQLLFVKDELQSLTNVCGACERIKNTPIPFSYSVFIKKFIFGYVVTLPFGYMFTLGYLGIPIIVFIFYVLASLELIAEEIEDPFGGDNNDLPTEKMALNIRHNVEDLLQA